MILRSRGSLKGPGILLVSYTLWMGSVMALGLWWVHFAFRQTDRIAQLEAQLGLDSTRIIESSERVKRMLLLESGAYLISLLCFSTVVIWLHYREFRRTASLQAFFAGMTHELKTPLAGVRLQAEAIADRLARVDSKQEAVDGQVGSQTQGLVQRLLQDTTRLEAQVERSLELARVQGGGRVHTQSVNLRSLVARLALTDFPDLKLAWVGNRADSLWVLGDLGSLQVVFRNIFENALRHRQSGKPLVAEGRGSRQETGSAAIEPADLQVEITESRDHRLIVEVVDPRGQFQGNYAKLGQLFEKGPQSQGAGVGLYLIRSLMKRMGGGARFLPQSSSGTTGFVVQLTFRNEVDAVRDSEAVEKAQSTGSRQEGAS